MSHSNGRAPGTRAAAARALAPALLALALAPLSARAQEARATLDAGASQTRYADSLTASALTLTSALSLSTSATTLDAAGTLAELGDGSWTTQGAAAASAFTPAWHALSLEGEGSAGGSVHQDGSRTGEMLAVGRVHLLRAAWGVWAGGGAGAVWDGASWSGTRVADVGGWARRGRALAAVAVRPTVVQDSLRYADAALSLRVSAGAFDVGATAGHRSGSALAATGDARSWASLTVTAWLAPRVALVASGGSYPLDLTQGYPGGRFASFALRLATARDTQRSDGASEARDAMRTADARAPRITVERRRDREVTLVVRAAGARSVEVMGTFTDWAPRALARRSDGAWVVTLRVPPGLHQLDVRVDGGAWVAPAGLPRVDDELAGAVALLDLR